MHEFSTSKLSTSCSTKGQLVHCSTSDSQNSSDELRSALVSFVGEVHVEKEQNKECDQLPFFASAGAALNSSAGIQGSNMPVRA
eukprot:CAMPEP_0115851874 /NCGR_PEP_ID=MMETSP0287-20121206/12705_1 /TAXON_ID=412157 /ORGANISM="Chrysochromulina rotalis, Strain UIO044" /LENGTH=83 /DNA_ID=CAMNT_0003305917 /DNA_START=185 /DNA_END=436 /DNA_ORIENTATION=-